MHHHELGNKTCCNTHGVGNTWQWRGGTPYERGRWLDSWPREIPPGSRLYSSKTSKIRGRHKNRQALDRDNYSGLHEVNVEGVKEIVRTLQNIPSVAQEPELNSRKLERQLNQFMVQSLRNQHSIKELLETTRQRLDQIDITLRSLNFRFLLLAARSKAQFDKAEPVGAVLQND